MLLVISDCKEFQKDCSKVCLPCISCYKVLCKDTNVGFNVCLNLAYICFISPMDNFEKLSLEPSGVLPYVFGSCMKCRFGGRPVHCSY